MVDYIPTKTTSGPLLSKLYKFYGTKRYWDQINVSASSETFHTNAMYIASYAFDFNYNRHWCPDGSKNESVLTICFNNHEVTLTNYSITPPKTGERIGRYWSLSGSRDNITYYDEEAQDFQLTAGKEDTFDWNHGPYRCIRLKVLGRTSSGDFKFDISQMEFFGTMRRIFMGFCTKEFQASRHLISICFLFIFMINN